ncbi:MAG: PQQ-binding-like beta-propeller repeat protein [Thermotogae bacterium]|nr:PQQ-binding-like beta-propeller repeat protein [Thermotogota bacterium]
MEIQNRISELLGSDGTIYVGSLDKNLYAINSDGSKKWSFTKKGQKLISVLFIRLISCYRRE